MPSFKANKLCKLAAALWSASQLVNRWGKYGIFPSKFIGQWPAKGGWQREQVGCSVRASYNQARQDRPAGGWAGQPTLSFGCPCWQR
ncbi:hypothetical protein QT397_20570 [Microbulbifer sp. MKSA007]|nr:hypothetical protein QT397_20570 [Microbulbifer sp. MKSA007]